MSDASRHSASFIEEVTYGTTPDTPVFKALRQTGTTLGLTKSTNLSAELRADRQIADFRHGTKQVGGDVNFELSFDSFHDLLEAALCGIWTLKATYDGNTFSVAATDSSFNDSGNGFISEGFEVGDIIEVSGFTSSVNNGTFTIATIAAGKITVAESVTFVDEAAGDSVSIDTLATVLKAGVERRSFSVMRNFSDQSGGDKPFHLYKGVIVNTFALNLTPDAIVTGTFGVVGQKLELLTEPPVSAEFPVALSTRVFDAFTGSLLEGGSPLALITELSFTLENGIAPRFVAFSDETILPQIGQSNLTGSVSLYFENATMYEKFIDETESSLEFTLTDIAGNSYIFNMPRISYTGGQPDVSGPGSITLTMPLQAIYDATVDTNFTITRIPVVV